VDVSGPEGTFPVEYVQRSYVGQLAAEKALSCVASVKESVPAISGFIVCHAELGTRFST
jgi:hypothetical protein